LDLAFCHGIGKLGLLRGRDFHFGNGSIGEAAAKLKVGIIIILEAADMSLVAFGDHEMISREDGTIVFR
jgi:hypothetical protein